MFAPAITASAAANVAVAQRVEATIDAGTTGIRYADSISVVAATLSPAIRIESRSATLGAAGSISQLSTSAWTAQASLDASAFTPSIGTLRGELAGSAGGSAHEDGTRTGQLEVLGRAHLVRGSWGAWLGGGAGGAWDGASTHALVLGDAGVWMHRGSFTAVLSATPMAIDDILRYTDAGIAVRWRSRRAEIGATLGARAGHGLIAGSTSWGSAGGVVWLAPHIGIVASAGAYPPDIAQGFPNGRYVSVALRVDNRRRWHGGERDGATGAEHRAALRDSVTHPGGAVVEEFAVEGATTLRTIRVRARGASLVELSGDITNWATVSLTPAADGWWIMTLTIPAGVHQLSVRVDGGQWQAPPGLVAVRDESGGAAGVWNAP